MDLVRQMLDIKSIFLTILWSVKAMFFTYWYSTLWERYTSGTFRSCAKELPRTAPAKWSRSITSGEIALALDNSALYVARGNLRETTWLGYLGCKARYPARFLG